MAKVNTGNDVVAFMIGYCREHGCNPVDLANPELNQPLAEQLASAWYAKMVYGSYNIAQFSPDKRNGIVKAVGETIYDVWLTRASIFDIEQAESKEQREEQRKRSESQRIPAAKPVVEQKSHVNLDAYKQIMKGLADNVADGSMSKLAAMDMAYDAWTAIGKPMGENYYRTIFDSYLAMAELDKAKDAGMTETIGIVPAPIEFC